MHEGLLILSNANQNVMFCNKPSQKLLEGAISYFEASQEATNSPFHDVDDLLKPSVFHPVKMATIDKVDEFSTKEKASYNLDQIITT